MTGDAPFNGRVPLFDWERTIKAVKSRLKFLGCFELGELFPVAGEEHERLLESLQVSILP